MACCCTGACCEGATCTITKHSDCQGSGQLFKGIGTVCSPNPCSTCDPCPGTTLPAFVTVTIHINKAFIDNQTPFSGVTGDELEAAIGGSYVLPLYSSSDDTRIFVYDTKVPATNVGVRASASFFMCNVNYNYGFRVKGDLSNPINFDYYKDGIAAVLIGVSPQSLARPNMCTGVAATQNYGLSYGKTGTQQSLAYVTVQP